MGNNSVLEHPGVISKIENGTIYVDIEVASACSSCHAKGYCTAFGKQDKIIEIQQSLFPNFNKGDAVVVIIKETLGMQALALGYILPVIVLITVLFIAFAFSSSEGAAAISALISVACYYLILYAFRKRIRKHFTFSIRHI